MANPEHLAILRQGLAAWNKWRSEYPYLRPDLSDEDLALAALSSFNLCFANFHGSLLRGAKLAGATLNSAELVDSVLDEADLPGKPWECEPVRRECQSGEFSGAGLGSSNFAWANLVGADVSSANLLSASLFGADLGSANFSASNLSDVNFQSANSRTRILAAPPYAARTSVMSI